MAQVRETSATFLDMQFVRVHVRSTVAAAGLAGLGVAATLGLTGCGNHGSAVPEGARTIAVTGDGFRFNPGTITVQQGEPVAVELTAKDVEHDLVVEDLGLHVHAGAGETTRGGMTADKTGRFAIVCTVSGHKEAGMVGELVVEPA